MVPTLPAINFEAPPVNPSPGGLYAATIWPQEGGGIPPRFMGDGVIIRPHNYGAEDSTGVWDVPWCGDPYEAVKEGDRPDVPDAFPPVNLWAFDYCDLTAPSRDEVRARALQNLRLTEQNNIERVFADRAEDDTDDNDVDVTNLVEAVAFLEVEIGKTGTLGFIHAGVRWAAVAAASQLLYRSGGKLVTPMGHTWVFGGGYDDELGYKLLATSPTYGWRTPPRLIETIEAKHNKFVAVAERTVVIGYEKAIAQAEIDD